MKNAVDTYIKRFLAQHSERRKFFCAMLMLAFFVSLAVYWRLKYTGIAMTNEVYCGLSEHTHSDDCYENVLVCGFEEGEEVFPSDETLSGEAVSASIHTHTDDCYEKVLICGLEEHTHTVDCLTDPSLDEDQTDGAETVSEDTSENSETQTDPEPAAFSDPETEISSDEPAAVSSDNSEACTPGGADGNPKEPGEEEEEQIYELPSLTGYTLTDFIAAAESQIGYAESKTDYTVSDEAKRMGFTIYGEWYGDTYGKWDAMFLAYCLDYAGITDEIFPKNSGAFAWYGELDGLGYYNEKEFYEPIPGDIVFFDLNDDDKPEIAGVVTEVDKDENKITVVEGDFPCDDGFDRVCENGFYLDDEIITGYGHIPDKEASAAVIYTAEDSGVNVKVTAAKEALPEEAELYITLYDESRSEYAAAGEAIGFDSEEANMAVVDIAFSLGGEKTEPTEAVDVSLDISGLLPETANPSTVSITHLAETEEGIEPVLVADASNKTKGTIDPETAVAEFTVDTFSDFTITWKDYDDDSNTVEIPITTYLYSSGTTTTTLGDGPAGIVTSIDGSLGINTVDLTSSNQAIAEFSYSVSSSGGFRPGGSSSTTYYCTLETATVYLVVDGTTVTITDAQSMSVAYDSSTDTYTYTVTTSSGTVTYTNVTSASISLYYSRTTSSSNSDQELNADSYNYESYVYWDVFEESTSTSSGYVGVGDGNASTYISSVTMGANSQIYVENENSNETDSSSWGDQNAHQLYEYFPNAAPNESGSSTVVENGILTITPQTGYYVTEVIIACCAEVGNQGGGRPGGSQQQNNQGLPYQCTTWTTYKNAFDASFSVTSGGVMEVDVSSLDFSHTSKADNYFILIMVSPVASPLYVQYDYGDIVSILGGSSYSGTAFASASGWTAATSGNSYGTGDGAQTEYTQYQYAYDTDPSEVANWTHYANSITDEAKEEAAAAGYYFAGWYTEYYYDITVTDTDQTTYGYTENYTYTFGSSIYTTATHGEGDNVTLPTHVKLTALWEPVKLTVTKKVDGLEGTEFASNSYAYPLTLQKYNETTSEWEYYDTVEITITGDSSSSYTFSTPIVPGVYRVVEDTTNISFIKSSSSILYLSVSNDGTLSVTTDYILKGGNLSLTYTVTNTYAEGMTEPLPETGGTTPLPYTAAFIIITGFVIYICKRSI